ncbi:flagellin lysine-N-methylase [Rummeliibacillus sp. NPDC094406]|uniref:flagellin lysine-N-methylase n=1 Tax=Rummeliibacillus sp. NPDC094406 TaxID=3364511 RepID=UPI00380FB91D
MTHKLKHHLIPTYYNEFKCIGGSCEDTCCGGWRITIDKKTFKAYKNERRSAIKNDLHKSILRNKTQDAIEANYGYFKLDEENKCSMLTEEGLCGVQKELGEQSLCNTCKTYPREIIEVNSIVEKSLTLSCPEAARIMLNRPNGIDFVEEEAVESIKPNEKIKHTPEENEIFWKIRIFMIDTLQNRNYSLETRLLVISMFIQKYSELEQINTSNVDTLISRYSNYLKDNSLEKAFSNIKVLHSNQLLFALPLLNYETVSSRYNNLVQAIKESFEIKDNSLSEESVNIYKETLNKHYKNFSDTYGYILENYLVNSIYEQIKMPDTKYLLDKFTSICVNFTLIRLFILGYGKSQGEFDQELALYCIQSFSKTLVHNSNYKTQITTILQQDTSSILSQITSFIHI